MDITALIAVVESSDVPLHERFNAASAAIDARLEPTAMNRVISALSALDRGSISPGGAACVALLLGEALRTVGEDEEAFVSLAQAVSVLGDAPTDQRGLIVERFTQCALSLNRAEDAVRQLRTVSDCGGVTAEVAQATAEALASLGRLDEAIATLDRAIAAGLPPGTRHVYLVRYRGVLRERRGEAEAALVDFVDADARVPDDAEPEVRTLAASSLCLGLLNVGRLDEAARAGDRAIELGRTAASPKALASAVMARASVCVQSGQFRLALGYYHEALVAIAKAGDRDGEVVLLNNVGQCYLKLGQLMLFVTYIGWALDSALELHDRENEALALMSLGSVWDPHEARGMFTEAWGIYAELQDSRGQAMALTGLARALEKLDETSDALHFLGKVADIGATTHDTRLTATAHLSMGQLSAKAEQPMAAWDHYERSWEAFEALRRLTFAEPVQFEVIEEAQDCVTGAISLALAQQENSASEEGGRLWRSRLFAMLERSRARVLTDRIGSTDVASQTLPPAAHEKLAGLANQVRQRQSTLHAERTAGTTEPGRLDQADEELRRTKAKFDEYEAFVAQSFPRYRSFSSVEPGDESSLDTALGRQVAVVEYVAIDDQLVSVVREHGELTVHRHGELAEITALDRELSELCSHSSDTSRITELSRRLHHQLLEPLERTGGLREAAELIVVPTPEVFGFPIEALRGADGYAFEKYAISYLPSTSVTRFLGSPPSSYEPALVMANPDGTLHRPEKEIAAICRQVKRFAGDGPFIGTAATKAQFMRWAPEVRLIHLASHAHFRADTPAFSSIVLAGDATDGTANLEVRDLPLVQMRSCLTVLSGCETGRGSVTGADEMIGFIRAFLAGGSCAVLATRWPVRDRATSVFMRAFYEGLIQEKLHPLNAIGRARAELMGIRPFQHPAFWAPFTYFGLPAGWNHANADGVVR